MLRRRRSHVLLWSSPDVGGTPLGRVRVELDRRFRRLPHPQDAIDASWRAALESNGRLFDGSKFRLAALACADEGDGARLVLRLGMTGYKEYLGTNQAPREQRLRLAADGERLHGDAGAFLSNALGCETVLVTADGQIALLRRSSAVATHGGLFNGPSGHPEPSRARVEEEPDCAAAAEAAARLAVEELFDSVTQETHEETNVPRAALLPPRCIGCMAAADEHGCVGKPDLLFVTRTTLDAAAVRAAYEQGAAEGWESDRLAFFPADVRLGEGGVELTPVTCCALLEVARHLTAGQSDTELRRALEAWGDEVRAELESGEPDAGAPGPAAAPPREAGTGPRGGRRVLQRGLDLLLAVPPPLAEEHRSATPPPASEDAAKDPTGVGQVWQEATDLLCDYLEAAGGAAVARTFGTVVELGAGAGVCGLVAARCGAARVVLTDYHSAVLEALRANVVRNGLTSSCEVSALSWGEAAAAGEAAALGPPGAQRLLLGSDLAPSEAAARLLGSTVVRLLGHGGVFLLSHRERRAVYLDRVAGAVVTEATDSALQALLAALAPLECRTIHARHCAPEEPERVLLLAIGDAAAVAALPPWAGRVDGGPAPVSPAAADPVRTPRIDARERAAFERDGFVVLDRLLSAEVCALLNQRLELVLRGEFDLGRPPDKVPRFKAEARCKAGKQPPPLGGPSKTTLQLINVHKADAAFRDVVCSPSLGRAVSRLGGWAGARVANDQVWAKPPGAAPLTFHRDSAYFDFVPSDVITVWLALDDMDDDVGPLQYVPGSHRWEDGRVGSAQQFFDKDRFALLHSAARREGLDPSAELGLVTVGVRMGGCGIHNGRLWHGSDRNASARPRRGLGIHFVPADAVFRDAEGKTLAHSIQPRPDGAAPGVELDGHAFPITYLSRAGEQNSRDSCGDIRQ